MSSIHHYPQPAALHPSLRDRESKALAKLTGREKVAQDFGRRLLRGPAQELKKKPGWQKEPSRQPVCAEDSGLAEATGVEEAAGAAEAETVADG